MDASAAQRIAVHCCHKSLCQGLEKLVRLLQQEQAVNGSALHSVVVVTSCGLYRDSHMPYRFSDEVPLTAKSSVKHSAPIRSAQETYG